MYATPLAESLLLRFEGRREPLAVLQNQYAVFSGFAARQLISY